MPNTIDTSRLDPQSDLLIQSTPKVSVIVPVYNTELYVERAIVSLMEQTLDDVQYIIIDDGSKDNSLSIIEQVLKRYPERQALVTLISRENRGVAATRSQGMEFVVGDYVIHLDSDDWAELNWLEAMYRKAIEDSADIVVCDYSLIFYSDKKLVNQNVYESGTECVKSLLKNNICNANWNKLIRVGSIKNNNVSFIRNIDMGEDFLVSLKTFYFAKKVSKVSSSLYNYNQTNESALTNSYAEKTFNDLQKTVLLAVSFLKDNNVDDDLMYCINYLKLNVKSTIVNNSVKIMDKKNRMLLYPETNFLLFRTKRLWRLKLYFILFYLKLDYFFK